MAHRAILSSAEILRVSLNMVEDNNSQGLSLRAVASVLGVKAPSLYRYFPQKEALELAVAQEVLQVMLAALQSAATAPNSEGRFRATAEAYLRFARERSSLYRFIMDRVPETHGSAISKAVWNLLLEAASGISGQPDDTAAAVATWSFLHGYAVLEHSGAFGASGPRGGFDLAMTAFVAGFSVRAAPARKQTAARAKRPRQRPGKLK